MAKKTKKTVKKPTKSVQKSVTPSTDDRPFEHDTSSTNSAPIARRSERTMSDIDTTWMKPGAPAWYQNQFGGDSKKYACELASEPHRVRNRLSIKVKNLDENFQQKYGGTTLTLGSLLSITQR